MTPLDELMPRLRACSGVGVKGRDPSLACAEAYGWLDKQASEIKRLQTIIKEAVDAFDSGNLQMSSPEIQSGDEPAHPWHEEWLHYASEAINQQSAAVAGDTK